MTFIEVMIAVGISSILLLTATRLITGSFTLSRLTFSQTGATETARTQLKRMVTSLRQIRTSDTGAYPLDTITANKIVFYSNVDSDAAIERVRYELIGTNLVRGVTEPTGSPLTYQTSGEKVSTLSTAIRNGNTPVFIYYGGDYPADQTQLLTANVTEVTYIQMHLIIDTDTNKEPGPVDIVSQVQMRNLKDNLDE
jgi:type II secretory pathway pseudopilin PulG